MTFQKQSRSPGRLLGRSLGKEIPQERGTPAFGHVAGAPYQRAEERKGSAARSPLVSDPFMPREGGSTGASVVPSGRCPHRYRCGGGVMALLALHQLKNTRSRFVPTLSSRGAQGHLSSPSLGHGGGGGSDLDPKLPPPCRQAGGSARALLYQTNGHKLFYFFRSLSFHCR